MWFLRKGRRADLTMLVFKDQLLDWNLEKSLSRDLKADHNSSRRRFSNPKLCSISVGSGLGTGGTLSVEVRGVDLSMELGKLLVEEFAEVKLVKFISTLCGLCFNLCRVVVLRNTGFGGLLETSEIMGFSSLGEFAIFNGGASVPFASSLSFLSPVGIRFGDGDLDVDIQDFRAKVAKDSDTDILLVSRTDLGIVGTGGTSTGLITTGSEMPGRSGELLTLCIQDLGRATKDFLLPTLSALDLSSLINLLGFFSSSLPSSFPSDVVAINPCFPLSIAYWPSRLGTKV